MFFFLIYFVKFILLVWVILNFISSSCWCKLFKKKTQSTRCTEFVCMCVFNSNKQTFRWICSLLSHLSMKKAMFYLWMYHISYNNKYYRHKNHITNEKSNVLPIYVSYIKIWVQGCELVPGYECKDIFCTHFSCNILYIWLIRINLHFFFLIIFFWLFLLFIFFILCLLANK